MSQPEKKNRIEEFTSKQLLLNVYVSQGLFLLIAIGIGLFFKVPFPWTNDFPMPLFYFILAVMTGILLPILSIQLKKKISDQYFDDGGINEKIFGPLSYSHVFVLTILIAFAEEWLFRGVIQNLAGLFITSVIFSILHVRYIKKPVLFIFVTLISFWLGLLYEISNTIWIPFLAHFLIDFISGCWIAGQFKKSLSDSVDGV
ncbi:type II CAAX endopeptidase family protein [Bacillus sp. NEB1478]|uniref:CPBP family intramembrane glutamic endopeptidase n=1 Tax=Bacillus sp. NEB1478 TaxID=3073816 RepID=UPI002873E277|nr:type II CAAX endopeptidase family protein [Bacillus sp. NEB1478]WNB93690.1 type II CAAX endopeptidase family protein [Bacillus sp. NEB1478]